MNRSELPQQRPLDLQPPEIPKSPRTGALRSLHLQGQPVRVDEALAREKRARHQDNGILDLIRRRWPSGAFTPWEVHAALERERQAAGKSAPLITSVRRALTNATKAGALRHWPQEKRPGPYGVDESCWSLAPPESPRG